MWKRDLFILGARIDPVSMDEALKYIGQMVSNPAWQDQKQHYIVTTNPEIVIKSQSDDQFRYIIGKASLSIADGVGILVAAKIFGEIIPERVTGADLMIEICRKAEINKWSIYLLGGMDKKNVENAATNLKKQFPSLIIAGQSSGLKIDLVGDANKPVYDRNENAQIISQINQSRAKVLFAAFGAPKQEKWIYENLKSMPEIKLAMGVGGAIDFLSGRVNRAPKFMRAPGLEWLYRLLIQPWRLPRIFNATVFFLLSVLWWRLRMATIFRRNVLGLILNRENQALLVSPSRHKFFSWQFPQGGVDKGETEEQAILREMSEELGVSSKKFTILKKVPKIYSYNWPKWARLAQGYRGQTQTLFILRFTGQDSDFDLKKDLELKSFKWVEIDQVVNQIQKLRKPVAIKTINELKKII